MFRRQNNQVPHSQSTGNKVSEPFAGEAVTLSVSQEKKSDVAVLFLVYKYRIKWFGFAVFLCCLPWPSRIQAERFPDAEEDNILKRDICLKHFQCQVVLNHAECVPFLYH